MTAPPVTATDDSSLLEPPTFTEEELANARKDALAQIYGHDFPLLADTEPDDQGWGAWAVGLWERHASGVEERLRVIEHNRLMYRGYQWVARTTGGRWQEPPKPRDGVRIVHNMIRPALNHRLQVLTEQRPGFRTKPASQDPDDTQKAKAQQLALEYTYDQQRMPQVLRETGHRCGTDGVSFWEVYWDPDAGPWHEWQDGTRSPLGDLRTRVYRAEQVRVSANASATERPFYWVLRETIPLAQAVREYGVAALGKQERTGASDVSTGWSNFDGASLIDAGNMEALMKDQTTVERYKVFVEPSEYLNEGLMLVAIGGTAVAVLPLFPGMVPMIRVTDGSADPAWLPEALMEDWKGHQVRVNAILSKWIESIRKMSGGRVLTRPGAISTETLIGGVLSAIEVKGGGPISDSVQVLQATSVGSDAKEALQFEIGAFEQKSGWTDAARGSFGEDASGRSVLAQREVLERIFAPPVNAAAQAMTDWGKICLSWMRWGYDIPRSIAVTGKGRPDLGRALSRDDFDGVCDVEVDAETLMPMPRALKLFVLDQELAKGAIDLREYRRRSPFALVNDLETPDEDHYARAKRVVDAILYGLPIPPILWQDDEAIHQNELERCLILRDDLPPHVRPLATQRWHMLAWQAQMKMMTMGQLAPAPSPTGPQPKLGLPPAQQPLLSSSPPVAAGTAAMMVGETDAQRAGLQFDQRSPQ